jgi:hypothetical protein
MRPRPIVSLKGERLRDSYPELWRLVTRKPERSPAWRDFWKVWLVGFVPTFAALIILDLSALSIGFGLLLALCLGATVVAGMLMRRLGVIRDYRSGAALDD